MSELIQNPNPTLQKLYTFAKRLIDGENGKMLFEAYRSYTAKATAIDTMLVFDQLLQDGYPVEKVKPNVAKIINVFFKSLNEAQWGKPQHTHFLNYLMQENREAKKIIHAIRPAIRLFLNPSTTDVSSAQSQLIQFIHAIKEYESHYIKKENILFPYLERTFRQHRCLQLMWSFHDDYRRSVKQLDALLHAELLDRRAINTELGKLFFVIIPIIFREEQIVFPVAYQAIPENSWQEMLAQSAEIGWCYGISPVILDSKTKQAIPDHLINLKTGFLSAEQIILMLDHLPVDITFVDENDEVCYFSGAKHRIFHRSNAIIGRKVQNCHPPESVHVVNDIVNAFHKGTHEHADFWITIKDKFIHIRYFALRDYKGQYKGTIEVSQDVTEIRELQGEQRLLSWKE